MYVWSNKLGFLAVAHAESVAQARDLLLKEDELGPSGDGTCPDRDRARDIICAAQPTIWTGAAAEFALTASASLRESIASNDDLCKEIVRLRAEIAALRAADKRSRETGCWCDEYGNPCKGCEWRRVLEVIHGE